MTKTEMVKILVEETEYTSKELNKINKDDVQEIFESVFEVEYEDDEFSEPLEIKEVEKEIVIDISKLSTVEQRGYRRTGQLPQVTINRYTRFDDENPKMEN